MTHHAVAAEPVRRIVALPGPFLGKPVAYVRVPPEAVAAHEAGHAAVAAMLGAPIKYIAFRSGLHVAGYTLWHEPPEWFVPGKGRMLTPHGALVLGLIAAAGPLAERVDDPTRATVLNDALDHNEMFLAFGYINAAIAAAIAPNAGKMPNLEDCLPAAHVAAQLVLQCMLTMAHHQRRSVVARLLARKRLLAYEVMPLFRDLPRYSPRDVVDAMRAAGLPTTNQLPAELPPWWEKSARSSPNQIP